jgi:dTDP-4-amino-4,6-dideoxygalactose transaminase
VLIIPFNRPYLAGKEQEYLAQAIFSGHLSGDGTFTRRCSLLLESVLGAQKVFLTTSCTHALELSALLLDLQPGDEVILPSFTFVSTANAFVLRGAKPVFCDIRADNLNLDENLLKELITPRTRAIIPVHYAGVGCEMDTILSIADRHGIAVVEDNAHGLFGKYRGKFLGTFGCLATQSFHETKNFTCGEGGALVINHPGYIERAEILREKGTNRSRFFRGEIDKYTWVEVGSSYLPSDLLSAILLGQLERYEQIQSHRKQIWEGYLTGLAEWAEQNGVRLPFVPKECEPAYHIFYLILPSLGARQRLIQYLRNEGIGSTFHYQPLHLSEMGLRFGGKVGDCPVTERVADQMVRLPYYYGLSPADQEKVCAAICNFSIYAEEATTN